MSTKKIPPLIYGTAWKKERTAELVEKAILSGFQGIDTACQPKHYDEKGVGQALHNLKKRNFSIDSLYIQTKFTPLAGQDPANVPYDAVASLEKQVGQSVDVSLKNLQVSRLDALLLHSPLPHREQTMAVWRAMEKLHQQGKVDRLGISNCYDVESFMGLFREAAVKPSILQNRFYLDTHYDHLLRAYCLKNNIVYQSFWTLTANPQALAHPLTCQLAAAKKVTEAQLFLRFLTQLKIIPLIGACSEKHMQQDLAIFSWSLTDAEISQLAKALAIK
jgi:diketogulonate reductase-like aldo/keto reductase